MDPQPVKGRPLVASLFVFSMGGTFVLFSSVPMLAERLANRSNPTPPAQQNLSSVTEAIHPLARGKMVGTAKRVRPAQSWRLAHSATSQSVL